MPAISVQSLFLIAGICAAIGCAVGWLIASLRIGQNDSSAGTAGDQSPKEGSPAAQPSLLRLIRDPQKGSLIVGLGEKVNPSAEGLSLDERKKLVDLLHETMTWAGIPPEAVMPPRTDLPAPALLVPAPDPLISNSLLSTPVETQRPTVLGGVTNALADVINPTTPKKEAPKSIVQQIDEILQDKLMGTELADEKIGLVEDPRKGVVVRIGPMAYEGIGSVPDGLVKDMLKASVQEWEKRQEIAKRRSTMK